MDITRDLKETPLRLAGLEGGDIEAWGFNRGK